MSGHSGAKPNLTTYTYNDAKKIGQISAGCFRKEYFTNTLSFLVEVTRGIHLPHTFSISRPFLNNQVFRDNDSFDTTITTLIYVNWGEPD